MSLEGTVKNGVVVLDNGTPLPEGAQVRVELISPKQPEPTLADDLLAWAGKAIDLPVDLAAKHDHYLHGHPKQ